MGFELGNDKSRTIISYQIKITKLAHAPAFSDYYNYLEEMNNQQKLLIIKVIHTVIWLFFVVIILFTLYCGLFDRVGLYTWIAIGLVFAEGIVLLIFQHHCPLTLQARKFSDSQKDNFDIFLPNVIAKYNKEIFTSIFVVAVILVLYRMIG